MKTDYLQIVFITLILSCVGEKGQPTSQLAPKEVVLISKIAPEPYNHYLDEDEIGETEFEKKGPYSPVSSPIFTYMDDQNHLREWAPKVNEIDTIVIACHGQFLELEISNYFTLMPSTFLLMVGDTVIFEYPNKLPVAEIVNRSVNDAELNYNSYRLSKLFNNALSTHRKVMLGILLDKGLSFDETSIKYYLMSLEAIDEEQELLDSLNLEGLISVFDFEYRKSNLEGLRREHLKNRAVRKFAEGLADHNNDNVLPIRVEYDLSQIDSLAKFAFFRDHLKQIARYKLPMITHYNENSGSAFIDSRIQFDSILEDARFNQTARNFLLQDAFVQILRNYSTADKEKYWKKMVQTTADHETLKNLRRQYGLDFRLSNELLLTSMTSDSLNYQNLLTHYRGKWIYIDFWGSWCPPCVREIPKSRALGNHFDNGNVEFVFLALNDNKENWRETITEEFEGWGHHYFIENGNVSVVLEDLNITSLPHSLIYSPSGDLINGNASRPTNGARRELEEYIKAEL